MKNMKTKQVENSLNLENVIDKIISAYPYLEVEKNNIIASVLEKDNNKVNKQQTAVPKTDYVLYKFEHDNKTLFRDTSGKVLDENLKLVGTIKKQLGDNKYEVTFFDQPNIKKYNLKELFPELIK